ncbi:MAG: hypothetical protein K0Q53_1474 [Massilibacillus sp.]|jgi:hypothetical protein|nr:hypothetical protein [Massilibacillus sp.]
MNTSTDNQKKLMVRGALLLAMAICFQGIRLIVPLPPMVGMFLIGSLVNMTLIVAVKYAGMMPALLMSCLLPIIAFFQGQLAIPIVVPVVALGNIVLVLCCQLFWHKKLLWLMPLFKTAVLYVGTFLILKCFVIPVPVAAMILLVMSWPQVITAIIGLILARQLIKKLSLGE